jgi:hypothetical protein
LLQAIAQITEPDPGRSCSAIVYYTACGLLPYLATNSDDTILRPFLLSLGANVESEANGVWARPKGVDLSDIKYGDGIASIPNIEQKSLKDALKSAIGPSGIQGANPHWPTSNSPEWLEHFGQNAATAISTAITTVLKELVPKITAQSRSDDGAMIAVIKSGLSSEADNLRADILYWKEALFSVNRKASYRHMSADAAVYWAARDLHEGVTKIHPQSIEFFLRETLWAALGDKETRKKLTLEQFCAAVAQDAESISGPEIGSVRRLTILEAVEGAATKRIEVAAAAVQTGVPCHTTIPRDEIGVLLFRDFQARRLAEGK